MKYTQNIHKIYRKSTGNLHELYRKYTQNIQKINTKYTQIMHVYYFQLSWLFTEKNGLCTGLLTIGGGCSTPIKQKWESGETGLVRA